MQICNSHHTVDISESDKAINETDMRLCFYDFICLFICELEILVFNTINKLKTIFSDKYDEIFNIR